MALSKPEREEFLAQPHIASLSVSAGDSRAPLTVPIWYQYSPGAEPWVLTGQNSRKIKLIEAAGCFSLMAHRAQPTARYVAIAICRRSIGFLRISARCEATSGLDQIPTAPPTTCGNATASRGVSRRPAR